MYKNIYRLLNITFHWVMESYATANWKLICYVLKNMGSLWTAKNSRPCSCPFYLSVQPDLAYFLHCKQPQFLVCLVHWASGVIHISTKPLQLNSNFKHTPLKWQHTVVDQHTEKNLHACMESLFLCLLLLLTSRNKLIMCNHASNEAMIASSQL